MVADKAQIAKISFLENLTLFDQESAPEKYHLYNGLLALSEAIIQISAEMERLRREVRISKRH
jgi:hypothetical protein